MLQRSLFVTNNTTKVWQIFKNNIFDTSMATAIGGFENHTWIYILSGLENHFFLLL